MSELGKISKPNPKGTQSFSSFYMLSKNCRHLKCGTVRKFCCEVFHYQKKPLQALALCLLDSVFQVKLKMVLHVVLLNTGLQRLKNRSRDLTWNNHMRVML